MSPNHGTSCPRTPGQAEQSFCPTVQRRSRKIKVVGRLKTHGPSSWTRSAVEDIFTVLAHSDGCLVCAGPAAHRQANDKVPNQESSAVVLANTWRHSKIVAGGELGASSATARVEFM